MIGEGECPHVGGSIPAWVSQPECTKGHDTFAGSDGIRLGEALDPTIIEMWSLSLGHSLSSFTPVFCPGRAL